MPSDFYGGVGVDLLYPSSLGMNQFSEPEWSSANIAPLPATDYSTSESYPTPAESRPPPIEVSSVPAHLSNEPRPKSSPSTFGPNVEDLYFPENPFKFRQDDYSFFPSPQPSGKSSPYYGHQEYAAPQPTSSRNSPQRQMPVPIAPDPVGMRQMQALKRQRDDDDHDHLATGQRKRKRAVSSTGPVELNEEETLLLKLKEEENLPWKDIAARFQSDLGKTYQVPALQMRFKRLRERMRAWTENDPNKKPMLNSRGGAPLYGRTATSAPPNMPANAVGARSPYQNSYRPMPLPAATFPGYPSGSLYPTGAPSYPTLSPNSAYAPNYSGPPATSPGTVPSNNIGGPRYPGSMAGSPHQQWSSRC